MFSGQDIGVWQSPDILMNPLPGNNEFAAFVGMSGDANQIVVSRGEDGLDLHDNDKDNINSNETTTIWQSWGYTTTISHDGPTAFTGGFSMSRDSGSSVIVYSEQTRALNAYEPDVVILQGEHGYWSRSTLKKKDGSYYFGGLDDKDKEFTIPVALSAKGTYLALGTSFIGDDKEGALHVFCREESGDNEDTTIWTKLGDSFAKGPDYLHVDISADGMFVVTASGRVFQLKDQFATKE